MPPRVPNRRSRGRRTLADVIVLLLLAAGEAYGDSPVSFTRDIAPVLAERCVRCHGDDAVKGGYRSDSYVRLLERGESGGPPVKPRDPEGSHLFQLLITEDADDRMPQKGERLDPSTVGLFRRWISEGAGFDGEDPTQPLAEYAHSAFRAAPPTYAYPVPIPAVAWLSQNRIATAGFREITVWSQEGILERRIGNVPERLQALVLHPDGTLLTFAGGTPGRNGAAGVVDLTRATSPRIFFRTTDTLLALAQSPDGSRIAVAGADRGIGVYEASTLTRIRTLTGHSDWVLDLAFSHDGQRLASASRDRTARVFDLSDGSLVSAFRDHKEAVTAVVFLPGTNRVATAGKDGRIRSWNVETGRDAKASEAVPAAPSRLRIWDGSVLSAWSDGTIREYRATNLAFIRALGADGEPLLGLAIHPDIGAFATTRHDGTVQVWEVPAGKKIEEFVASPTP